ncbi:hypothetical protein HPP92_028532 [Vanilla planifolia]|uniref:Uncharacterized protein n=1 Tax=Vanilla planifolia TaxID=51239 RepID=A0A835U5P5_VANPL|nr:hypothetical protein HPP92_028532 [Vanilla planifolia]
MTEFAAFHLCENHLIFSQLPPHARKNLVERCCGNWKKVLRFLQSVEQSTGTVNTSAGNPSQMGFLRAIMEDQGGAPLRKRH